MSETNPFVDETATYKPDAIRALREFKALKTFKPENRAQRHPGLEELANKLARAYGLDIEISLVDSPFEYLPETNGNGVRIVGLPMAGRLSILTLLHNFAGIRTLLGEARVGETFEKRQKWAVNLFRKVYPRQFARLIFDPYSGFFFKAEDFQQQQPPVAPFVVQLAGTQLPLEVQAILGEENDFPNDEESTER